MQFADEATFVFGYAEDAGNTAAIGFGQIALKQLKESRFAREEDGEEVIDEFMGSAFE